MDKRFVNFLLVSLAVMMGYSALVSRFEPERPIAEDPAAKRELIADPEAQQQDFADDPVNGQVGPDAPPEVEDGAEPELLGQEEDETPTVDVEPQWTTLGSLDPTSPYRMLVTLNNRGATVERIELNSPRYQDTNTSDPAGYLGHLVLEEVPGGCLINVVGAGTPAELAVPNDATVSAGLKTGDVIVSFDGQAVPSPEDFQRLLQESRPGQKVRLDVQRSAPDARDISYTVTLAKRPLAIIRPESSIDQDDNGSNHPLSFLLTFDRLGSRSIKFGDQEIEGLPSLHESLWQTTMIDTLDGPVVEFRYRLGRRELSALDIEGEIEVAKRFRLQPIPTDQLENEDFKGYHLTMELEFRNLGNAAQTVAYQLDGPTGLPLEGWWYSYKTHPTKWSGAGARDVMWRTMDGKHQLFGTRGIVKKSQTDSPQTQLLDGKSNAAMYYAGVDSQYFTVALLAEREDAPDDSYDDYEGYRVRKAIAHPVGPIDEIRDTRTDVSFRLTSQEQRLEPGETWGQRYQIFAGPKKPAILTQYDLQEAVVYGWFWFVSKPMLSLLHLFYSIFRNYGIAIILLTVLVRGLMFPLGKRQAQSAQKMQELAPEMKKIAEKYKNDMEKRGAAQRELFRKHNYNPFGGCLLLFFQLPVFVGLYRALSVDVGLRQAPFIPGLPWCSDLSAPDMLWHWEGVVPSFIGGATGWLGPYFNILPLISSSLFLVHQKLFTPPPADEQQEMQQQIMKFMTLFMGILFFKVPSGLCLYFITSSLWAVAERKLLPKTQPPSPTAVSSKKEFATVSASTGSGNGNAKKSGKARKKQKRR